MPSERMSRHQISVLKSPESCGVGREKLFSEEDFLFSCVKLAGYALRSEQQSLADGRFRPKDAGLQRWDRQVA